MEQFEIIQQLLDAAKPHNLEMECIASMVNNLVPFITDDQLKDACNQAFYDWDL